MEWGGTPITCNDACFGMPANTVPPGNRKIWGKDGKPEGDEFLIMIWQFFTSYSTSYS